MGCMMGARAAPCPSAANRPACHLEAIPSNEQLNWKGQCDSWSDCHATGMDI